MWGVYCQRSLYLLFSENMAGEEVPTLTIQQFPHYNSFRHIYKGKKILGTFMWHHLQKRFEKSLKFQSSLEIQLYCIITAVSFLYPGEPSISVQWNLIILNNFLSYNTLAEYFCRACIMKAESEILHIPYTYLWGCFLLNHWHSDNLLFCWRR